jgi:hypothetical protein
VVKRSFLDELARGIEGEKYLIDYLESDGFVIEDWAQTEAVKTHKGPRLDGYIKPDLLVYKNSKHYYIDSKSKDAPRFFGKTKEWRHGIDGKCYRDYKKVQEKTGNKVWIAFIEPYKRNYSDDYSRRHNSTIDIGGVLFTAVDHIPVNQEYNVDGYSGMVYWNRDTLLRGIV